MTKVLLAIIAVFAATNILMYVHTLDLELKLADSDEENNKLISLVNEQNDSISELVNAQHEKQMQLNKALSEAQNARQSQDKVAKKILSQKIPTGCEQAVAWAAQQSHAIIEYPVD